MASKIASGDTRFAGLTTPSNSDKDISGSLTAPSTVAVASELTSGLALTQAATARNMSTSGA